MIKYILMLTRLKDLIFNSYITKIWKVFGNRPKGWNKKEKLLSSRSEREREMQKTVTLVYSSDTFSRIMHNLSSNGWWWKRNETRHGWLWCEDNGKCVNLPVCVTTCSNKDTPLVITPVDVCLTTFFSTLALHHLVFTLSHCIVPCAHLTRHAASLSLYACFIIFHCIEEEIGHIKRWEKKL